MPQQFLIIIVTFILGYFTATIFDIDALGHWMNNQVLSSHEPQQQPVRPAPQNAQIPPKPKFEFYTLLANEKKAANSPQPAAAQTAGNATTNVTAIASAAATTSNSALNKAPQQPTEVKVAVAKPVMPAPVDKGSYLVQVASFKTQKDAEHMKASLTLKGFEVNVVPVTNPQGNWFRVVVGPYANRGLAQKVQLTLAKTERLNGMVRSAGG